MNTCIFEGHHTLCLSDNSWFLLCESSLYRLISTGFVSEIHAVPGYQHILRIIRMVDDLNSFGLQKKIACAEETVIWAHFCVTGVSIKALYGPYL